MVEDNFISIEQHELEVVGFLPCGKALAHGVLIYEGGGKHPYAAHCVLRNSWGGGDPTPSDHTFDPVITWEEGVAQRNVVINASEGGVSLRVC